MSLFIAGIVIFFGLHLFSAFRSRTEGRDIRVKMGYAKYMGVYSVASLIGFGLMLWGYGQAPDQTILYEGPHGLHHVSWMFMLPALILLVAAYTPLGHIKRLVQHPMMLAVLIWAVFHLVLGGDLKRVLLFGTFAVYAALSLLMAYRRGTDLEAKQPKIAGDVLAVFIGLILTGLFMHGGHQYLFGVSPM